MADLTPRIPRNRPLIWHDTILDWQAQLQQLDLPPVYIAGGAVRDALLHHPVKDIDLVTTDRAIPLARQIADMLDGDIFIMDRERDVARVFYDEPQTGRMMIDVTGLRGDDLLEDLQARDFTMNAMAVDLAGDLSRLIDPLDGEQDILDKRLRQCRPDSIESDPIRALRGVRQSVQLRFRIEAETLTAIRRFAPVINTTSLERARDEFYALLKLDSVRQAMRVADTVGMVSALLPWTTVLHEMTFSEHVPGQPADAWQHTLMTLDKLHTILLGISLRRTDETAASFGTGMLIMQIDRHRSALNQHFEQRWANDRPHRALLMLAVLVHTPDSDDRVRQASETADALRLSNPEKKRLIQIVQAYQDVLDVSDWTPVTQHRYWYRLKEAGIDALMLALASYLARSGTLLRQSDWLVMVERARLLLDAWFEQHDRIVDPPLPVNGNDLMEQLSLSGGRIIGELLTLIREACVTGTVQTADDALMLARAYLAQQDADRSD